MLKSEYHELFGAEEMHRAAGNVYDAFEFLELLGERLNKHFRQISKKIMYHVPCHLKTQSFGTPAADILR